MYRVGKDDISHRFFVIEQENIECSSGNINQKSNRDQTFNINSLHSQEQFAYDITCSYHRFHKDFKCPSIFDSNLSAKIILLHHRKKFIIITKAHGYGTDLFT